MKECSICGRQVSRLKKGMCNKHYRQLTKYGEVLDNNPRNRNDPNEIVIYDDFAEIILYNNECQEIARALIDLEDISKVEEYKWYLKKDGYVYSNDGPTRLHRLVMDCPEDMIIDHVNRDRLDNRKSNLRICTTQQNSWNHSVCSRNTSGTTGVSWNEYCNKWYAQIMINGKTINLGYYDKYEDAIQARKDAEDTYFGDFKRK